MVDAFFHEQLGAVLVMQAVMLNNDADSGFIGEAFYLRTPCDGDPVYLEELADFIQEHWVEGAQPTFSAN